MSRTVRPSALLLALIVPSAAAAPAPAPVVRSNLTITALRRFPPPGGRAGPPAPG